MDLLKKTDEEILEIATPLWDGLVKCSNNQDYAGFAQHFCKRMLQGANEIEIGKQWAGNNLTKNLSKEREFLGCLRRGEHITVLYKQSNDKLPGDYLGRLVLGIEDDKVKIFGATIF